ncbi:MAG: hypothetical protein ACE5GA_00205 [Candidatus Zixiibacteriota bacterium]
MKTRAQKTTASTLRPVVLLCALSLASGNLSARPLLQAPQDTGGGAQAAPQLVLPSLIRQVIHDKGNIATTVDNWGLIGGYSFISEEDFPSGEWPRNSQHSYIAEIKYWMGAVNTIGDTILANTADDFQPMSSLLTGSKALDILLSTDSASYAFNPADTIGAGVGSPALGWRVWNSDSSAWVYNQVFSSTASSFFPGGPIAVQESHYRFNDAARGVPALGLELTQTIYQWNFCYNENFFFVVLNIKNTSAENYPNFAFGIYSDFDVGGFHAQTGENGRLNDMVGFDSANGLAWTYDVTGWDAGWNAETGVMGTKYLQTPDSIGMTAFRTELWDNLPLDPNEDAARFELISANTFDAPLPPNDQIYIQCTNGINLTAGKTVQVIYAIVAGADEAEFRANADLAQTLFDNFFVGPLPPPTPTLSARNADGRVYLDWDNIAESFVDPLSAKQDFLGYKLYRSEDFGLTWGKAVTNISNSCQSEDFETVASFRVAAAGDPVTHTYIDTGLINGKEYWYCLAAFDAGDTAVPIDPLQNSFGTPGSDRNVIRAIPSTNPAGYFSAQSTVFRTQTPDSSHGNIWPILLDPVAAGSSIYKVGFREDDFQTFWALTDSITGDTLLADQTLQFDYMSAVPDSVVGFFPIARGLRVAVFNGDRIPSARAQTVFAGPDTTLFIDVDYGMTVVAFGLPASAAGSDKHFRADYEIRFTAGGSVGADAFDGVTPVTLPFEVWNVTSNQQVHTEILDWTANGVFDAADGDGIAITNFPYDGASHPEAWPDYHVWMFSFDVTAAANVATGDVFTVSGAPVNGPSDEFFFTPDGINLTLAANQLSNIRVAPNPYLARADLWESSGNPTQLNFIHLPGQCQIRIYTLAGDLVNTIDHNSGLGDESWNLISSSGQLVASGIYLYHVSSSAGEFLGRFAVIK